MDEKTERLRDLFLDVAEEETVTESQQVDRGTLATDATSVDERLLAVVDRMKEKFGFTTDLTEDQVCTVVRQFYAGSPAVETDLEATEETVFFARMQLHLVRDSERPDDAVTEAVVAFLEGSAETTWEHASAETVAASLASGAADFAEDDLERAVAVALAEIRSRRVSHRFRTAFEEILTDADLTVQFTTDAHEDGLEGATADAEVDVDF